VEGAHTLQHKAGYGPQKHTWLSHTAGLSQQRGSHGELLLHLRRPLGALRSGEGGKG